MSRCDTLRTDLKAYQDGRLPLPQRLRVRRHLKGCESCRQELAQIRQIGKELRQMEREAETTTLDPGLRARILASIPEGLPDAQDSIPSFRGRSRSLALWGGLAAAALLAVVVYPRFASNSRLSESVPPSAAKMSAPPATASTPWAAMPQAPGGGRQNSVTVTDSEKSKSVFYSSGASSADASAGSPTLLANATPPLASTPSASHFAPSHVAGGMPSPMQNTSNYLPDTLVLQLDDLKEGRERVQRIASAVQGQIAVEQPTGTERDYLELKVPADRFDSAKAQLSQLQLRQKTETSPGAVDTVSQSKSAAPIAPDTQAHSRVDNDTIDGVEDHTNKSASSQSGKRSGGRSRVEDQQKAAAVPMRTLRITLEQKHNN